MADDKVNPYLAWFGDRFDGVVDSAGTVVNTTVKAVAEYDPTTPLDVVQSGVEAVPAVAASTATSAQAVAWTVPATAGVLGVLGLGGAFVAKKKGWL